MRHLLLSWRAVVMGAVLSSVYFMMRSVSLVIYYMFLFYITRTQYRIRSFRVRLALWLPIMALIVLLLQNNLTHNVFEVTTTDGYARGALMSVFYAVAILYCALGIGYCIMCRRYLTFGKWVSLLSVYVLSALAMLLQMYIPEYLVEMFSTSIGLLMIMLIVMRPEETMDITMGTQSWNAYQADIKNILLSRQRVQIVVVQLTNAQQIRAYLGDYHYTLYARSVIEEIRSLYKRERIQQELYFEQPGTIYLILEDADYAVDEIVPKFMEETRERTRIFADLGVRFEPKICLIRCPYDMRDARDIFNLGHRFVEMGEPDQMLFKASDIVRSRDFEIENHMEEILNRAITEHNIEMYYQPIYDIKRNCFRSAEALARLTDSKYGRISPAIFIPAAEKLGLILPIGDAVLENVFRFIANHDMRALGLDYIEVNLSVAQCMQRNLPETIQRLMQKYKVRPDQINLEITETTFDDVNDVARNNIRRLYEMGFSFSLDDYGTGYSNIQRLSRLPLSIIKIDKTMIDEMFSRKGRVIIQNTVRMMQGIDKAIVVEGVETQEELEGLKEMSCDYIQGYYFSKPLSASDFEKFLRSKQPA